MIINVMHPPTTKPNIQQNDWLKDVQADLAETIEFNRFGSRHSAADVCTHSGAIARVQQARQAQENQQEENQTMYVNTETVSLISYAEAVLSIPPVTIR